MINKILLLLYHARQLQDYRPKCRQYRRNQREQEAAHQLLKETLAPDQLAAFEDYINLVCQGAVLEQQEAFVCGAKTTARLLLELAR